MSALDPGDFAHDDEQRHLTAASEGTDSPTAKCEHPSWLTRSDGHLIHWYECSECGYTTRWAPWLLSPPEPTP